MSPNGKYAAVKSGPRHVTVSTDGNSYTYVDNFGEPKAMALSGEGIMIATFVAEINTSGDGSRSLSVVRILDVKSDRIRNMHNEVWTGEFGSGIAITASSEKIAIGSPEQNKVYTYDMKFDRILRQSRSIINCNSSDCSAFGSKVALSARGDTIAIAAPESLRNDRAVGKVFVFVWTDNLWEPIEMALYGGNTMLHLGSSGIAIDDASGRLDLKINDMDQVSFQVRHFPCHSKISITLDAHILIFCVLYQFYTSCIDRHATAIGHLGNAFAPLCECFSGFKSSNPSGRKVLLRETDACLRCSSDDGCGFAPTVSPSVRPSMTSLPSASPTESKTPSMTPSISLEPSGTPSTLEPSPLPSTTHAPSLQPSVGPSSLDVFFDGDSCRFSGECKSGICLARSCFSKVCISRNIIVQIT